jgi:hypothetical protein
MTIGAIPVTTIARTLVDVAATAPRLVAAAVHRADELEFDFADAFALLERERGRRGMRRLRLAIAEWSETAGAVNDFERDVISWARTLIAEQPLVNGVVHARGRSWSVDLHWPSRRVVLECDGFAAHRLRRNFERDRERDAALIAEGWVVFHLTKRRFRTARAAVAGELRTVLRRGPLRPPISRRKGPSA